eukprot:2279490-Amphidinium_carterae.2
MLAFSLFLPVAVLAVLVGFGAQERGVLPCVSDLTRRHTQFHEDPAHRWIPGSRAHPVARAGTTIQGKCKGSKASTI